MKYKLTFNISKIPIMAFMIDFDKKSCITLQIPPINENSAFAILKQHERTYTGIEARLNQLANKKYTLLEWLPILQKGDFYADSQHNLNISVEKY